MSALSPTATFATSRSPHQIAEHSETDSASKIVLWYIYSKDKQDSLKCYEIFYGCVA